jgi:hypothetical protein
MRTVLKVAVLALMACSAVLLGLGLLFWSGNAYGLVGIHVALGLVLVGSLWTVAGIAARVGVPAGPVTLAAGWGLLVLALGMRQQVLLPGAWHWVVEVLHLVVSMGAVAWGRYLARQVGKVVASRAAARVAAPVVSADR